MRKLLRKPKQQQSVDQEGKYHRFSLSENPFPINPVNKDSTNKRINGEIYEADIRTIEYEKIETPFLKKPQTDLSHLRLGYIYDTSYIGRGNGKSAFIVNLMNQINKEYCLDISAEINKCFAVYVAPEPGGRTKTFDSFVNLLMEAILTSNIIETTVASLRLEAINKIYPEKKIAEKDENRLVKLLNSERWFKDNGFDLKEIMNAICKNEYLQRVSNDFPLMSSRHDFFHLFITKENFHNAYENLKKGREKLDFVFSNLVLMFMASGFNGAYIFVDDFERVPDFQSVRQKRDFATELRSILLDGPYENAKYGFFNMFLVLHAGVPALVKDAWSSSGMDQRYPISPKIESSHLIPFEKLNNDHVNLLIKKYLEEYRLDQFNGDPLTPFTKNAISKIAEESEYNAATILRTCSTLIEKSLIDNKDVIDESFVRTEIEKREGILSGEETSFDDSSGIDLMQKAKDKL